MTGHDDSLANTLVDFDLFRKYDSNNNGLIEKEELANIIKEIYEKID